MNLKVFQLLAPAYLKNIFQILVDKVEEAKRFRQPFFISQFPMGYLPVKKGLAFNSWNNLKRMNNEKGFLFKSPIALGVIFAELFGLKFDYDKGLFYNQIFGGADPKHTHPDAAIVIGLNGVENVPTNLYPSYSDQPFVKPVIMRGSLLFIPNEMPHSVDGFKVETFKIRDRLIEMQRRETFAFFPKIKSSPDVLTEEQVRDSVAKYILSPEEAAKLAKQRKEKA